MEEKFESADQAHNSIIIVINTSLRKVEVELDTVVKFIEDSDLNVTDSCGGNAGSGDPCDDLPPVEERSCPFEYLDRHFEEVMKQFWQTELKRA